MRVDSEADRPAATECWATIDFAAKRNHFWEQVASERY